MRPATKATLLLGGGLLAAWTAWGVYARRTAESIPYEAMSRLEDIDIRRYPRTILAETSAPDQITAFRRLFRYISGANVGTESIAMTTPVETRTTTESGEEIAMTTPVRTEPSGSGTRMGFYLPIEYGPDDAPEPTDSTVRLVIEPPKTVAVKRFSWYAPGWRVARLEQELVSTLDRTGVEYLDDPSLLRYNDPWTPPFMRRNELSVEIDETTLPN